MISSSKRMLVLVPALMVIVVATTSSVDRESLTFELCKTQGAATQSAQCAVVANSLNWFDWITGSSSTQFHFIDLLELITPNTPKE